MKRIIITGTSKGIGYYLAQELVNQDFFVIGCSRSKSLFKHENYLHFQVDLNKESEILSLFGELKKRKFEIFGLLNNAGIAKMMPLITTPTASFLEMINLNVLGTFIFLRESAKMMSLQKEGRIINFSSVANALNIEWEGAYSATKASVESLTKTAAREFQGLGITVNCIAPGPTDTDLIKNVKTKQIDYVLDKQVVKKKTQFADILNTVEYFLSEKSNMISGQIVHIGGV